MKSSSRSAGAASVIARQTKICITCLPNTTIHIIVFIIQISIVGSVYTMLHYITYTVIHIA